MYPHGRPTVSIAFTSSRGNTGFIGVYALAEKTLTYLDPSTQTDRYPEWSPDSKQVAFIHTAGGGGGAHRAGEPLVDPRNGRRTGAGHEVWRAAKGQGSVFHPLDTDRQFSGPIAPSSSSPPKPTAGSTCTPSR